MKLTVEEAGHVCGLTKSRPELSLVDFRACWTTTPLFPWQLLTTTDLTPWVLHLSIAMQLRLLGLPTAETKKGNNRPSRGTASRIETCAEWEKIYSARVDFIPRICKELQKLNIKQTNLPINKWANELNSQFSKRKHKQTTSIWKRIPHFCPWGKCQLDCPEVPSRLCQTGCLLSRKQMTMNTAEEPYSLLMEV